MRTVTLPVKGLNFAGCAREIEKNLSKLEPIAQIETSYDAATMLVTFVLFGHWMEMRSRRGSSDALNALLRLAPSQANVIQPTGEVETVPVERVQVDDLLLLRPGEKVPVDGLVTEGESSIDESMVSGESIPVSKQQGSEVIGGTVNGSLQRKSVVILPSPRL